MWIVIAAKFWREIIIVFLAFLLLITLMLLNVKTGKLKDAEAKCQQRISDANQRIAIVESKLIRLDTDIAVLSKRPTLEHKNEQ